MTGAELAAILLRADTTVTARVPQAHIKLGALPEGAPLPALLVRTVSSSPAQFLRRGSMQRETARVSVLVRAASYREQVAIMKAVRRCCADWTGDMAPAERVAILAAGDGPDVIGPSNSFEQTTDFRVSFDIPV